MIYCQFTNKFGQKTMYKCIRLLIILFCVNKSCWCIATSTVNTQLITDPHNSYSPYNSEILNIRNHNEFTNAITELTEKKKSISINKVLQVYDKEIKKRQNTTVYQIIELLTNIIDRGSKLLQKNINDFNRRASEFSNRCENGCIELMKLSYQQGVFASWKGLDDLVETEKKINEAKDIIIQQNSETNGELIGLTLGTVATAMTGDILSSSIYLAKVGESLWDVLSFTKKTVQATKQILNDTLTMGETIPKQYSPTEKKEIEEKMYSYSRLYCTFGYNLQIVFNEDTSTLDILGDKIDYQWIINLINVLDQNIAFQITKFSVEFEKNKSKLVELELLVSTKQRLSILKTITDKLADIVNFAAFSHIEKLQRVATILTITEIQQYFNRELDELNELVLKLDQLYPKQKEQIQKHKELLESDIENQVLYQEVMDMKSNATSRINKIAAERVARVVASEWSITSIYVKNWVDIGVNNTVLLFKSFGKISITFGDLFLQIPYNILDIILNFINEVLWVILTSPAGCILLLIVLTWLSFIGGGFVSCLTNCILMIWNGLYKIITLPCRIKLKKD